LGFLVEFAPAVQQALSSYYNEICTLSNSVYDKELRDRNLDGLEDAMEDIQSMKEVVRALRDSSLSKNDIASVERGLSDVRSNVSECCRQSDLDEIRRAIEELKAQRRADLPSIRLPGSGDDDGGSRSSDLDVQSARSLSRSGDWEGDPAVAAVTPRGKASHTMMFGDGPGSSRPGSRKRDLIDDPARPPRRVPKAAKVQLPGDGHSSARLH
jgi:hypothetical protein